ncbi:MULTISPECIES: arsenic resistance N-acetyltransferase ArsN2 [unclassified Duganella]|uniref:arsenic resistance N-acetyltransferase ArsN2 n=1 Tax=unclassified Duganella TaxID=2636909 RepID=UPI000E34F89C|nr:MULTISPECIES: arsenic resistance N-acetyltransferase ArsN2 [unclassified Duganella]RFP09561.1 GNAT family N-acetyltransferase [Duganella sp. BJB475]RFP27681.1 GNAT family N-acetyltransferase [Duganella sp. BJB476]
MHYLVVIDNQMMHMPVPAATLLREIVRLYVRDQRKQAKCGDGASTVQCHVLTELLREEGLPQQALAERLGLDKGWISRAVDTLVTEGCISKQASEQDRRSVVLSLTPAGRTRARQLEQQLNDHAAQLLAQVSQDHHAQVQESLRLLLNALTLAPTDRAECGATALRPATRRDWPQIKRMLLEEGLPQDGAQEHLAQFVVGESDGKLVCAGGLEVYGVNALLRSVVVKAGSRDQGWGRQLLTCLTEQASGLGVTTLYLLTTTAASYFSNLGFVVVSRKRIPDQLYQSHEFQGACPASATAMKMLTSARRRRR